MYSCGFRAFLFVCGFRLFLGVTHTVTHTGIGRVIFGRLVCSLFYAAAILFRSALYERLGFLAPTLLQKCPTLAFYRLGLVVFPLSCLLRSISGGRRSFFSPKRNDLQFPAMRVRIRHGGDFPGIKITPQQAEALPTPPPCAKVSQHPCTTVKQHCDKHSILDLPLKNKIVSINVCKGLGGEIRQPLHAFFYFGGFPTIGA